MPKVGPYNLKHSEVCCLDEAYTVPFVELQSLRNANLKLAELAATGDYFWRSNMSDFPYQPFNRTEGFLFNALWLTDPKHYQDNKPLIVYVSSHVGKGKPDFTFNFPVLLSVAAELNLRVLEQQKRRQRGNYKMQIRVPHR